MIGRLHFKRLDVAALALLTVLPILALWPIWLPTAANPSMVHTTALIDAFANSMAVNRLLESGSLILWNPYQYERLPFTDTTQVAPLYLPNLMVRWLHRGSDVSYLGFELIIIGHYIVGGIGRYLFMRGLQMRAIAALVGAIALECSSLLIAQQGQYNILIATTWLPFVLVLLDRAWAASGHRRSALGWSLIAGLLLSQLLMAGHLHSMLFCVALLLTYAIWRWVGDWQLRHTLGTQLQRLCWILRIPVLLTITCTIGIGCAAIALLPLFELLSYAHTTMLADSSSLLHGFSKQPATTLIAIILISASGVLVLLAAFNLEVLLRRDAPDTSIRLQQMHHVLWRLFSAITLGSIALYLLLVQHQFSIGAEHDQSLVQLSNQYLLTVLLLLAIVVLLCITAAQWAAKRVVVSLVFMVAALGMGILVAYAGIRNAAYVVPQLPASHSIPAHSMWQHDQQQLIDWLTQIPVGIRVDNSAEVLPISYGSLSGIRFSSDTSRRDLDGVGYILTAAEQTEPPEAGAISVFQNRQGRIWQRATLPNYASFSVRVRPSVEPASRSDLSNSGSQFDQPPTIANDAADVRETLARYWPALTEPSYYRIGTTGVQSPVDISVLAGESTNDSVITVAGRRILASSSGTIIALLDPQHGSILIADTFDSLHSGNEQDRFAHMLESAPVGTILVLASHDQAILRASDRAWHSVITYGTQTLPATLSGQAYALIGVKGATTGTAFEKSGEQLQIIDVGIAAAPAAANVQFSYQLVRYAPDQITLLAENNTAGLLSIAERVYPGWEVYVDGITVPILRSNTIQRAVVLPPTLPGKPHEVTFAYRPNSLRLGTAISLLTLSVVLSMLLAISITACIRRPIPLVSHTLSVN